MKRDTAGVRVAAEQAVERFRTRTVSELRKLNADLPRSLRLERREIDRLVDDLLSAIREAPRRRNATMLDKTVLMASASIVRAVRRLGRRPKAGAAMSSRTSATAERGRNAASGDLLIRVLRDKLERPEAAGFDEQDRNRSA